MARIYSRVEATNRTNTSFLPQSVQIHSRRKNFEQESLQSASFDGYLAEDWVPRSRHIFHRQGLEKQWALQDTATKLSPLRPAYLQRAVSITFVGPRPTLRRLRRIPGIAPDGGSNCLLCAASSSSFGYTMRLWR
jgi:hypothetical protein